VVKVAVENKTKVMQTISNRDYSSAPFNIPLSVLDVTLSYLCTWGKSCYLSSAIP
jgi:hypothetical protein